MSRLVDFPAGQAPAPDCLRGRVVLVTGATGGLGRAAAMACAAAGATVVLLGRRVRALEQLYDALAAGNAVQPAIYPLDLAGATPGDYAELAVAIERECGRLDGVLHAAAHFSGLFPLGHEAPDEWARGLQVNLIAPVLVTHACLPLLERAPAARVVFVLDDPARIERAFWGPYAAAKAGLAGVVGTLADELENSPVAVCGLLPGPMRTALRARAYFAENPHTLPLPARYAPACVFLLGGDGAEWRGATLDARAYGARAEG